MGASTSTPNTDGDLNQRASVLYSKLTVFAKLSEFAKANKQYELCSILKDIMEPYELVYFVESMLPMLVKAYETKNNIVGGGNWQDDFNMVVHTTFISIYEKLLDNAELIVKRIDSLASKGGKRAPRKKTANIK